VPGQLTDSLEALDLSEFLSRACEFGVAFLCDRKSRDKAPERNDSLAHVHVGRSPEAVWGKFALDSPLEGDGFEPSVPQQIRPRFRDRSPVSHDGLTVSNQ
jgi:hypothetical protein